MALEVVAGLGLFKTMLDTAKGLKDINDATVRNAVAIELQEKILAAQAQQTALVQRVGELEAEVTRLKNWEADKERYKLKSIPPGVFVYALKPDMAAGEPPHNLCQTCYHRGKKSILDQAAQNTGRTRWKCHECGAERTTGHFVEPRVNR